MPFIGQQPITGAYHKLDSITTSATATYNLQLNGGAYYPTSANHLLVSLNGVMQAPQDSFTVSGSQITFASALTSSDSIDFIMALGDVLDIGVPSDGAVNTSQLANDAVTDAKIASGISSSKLTGALPAIDGSALTGISGGKVLQVVQTVKTNTTTWSSSGYASFGLDVTITPSATTSKVFLLAQVSLGSDTSSANINFRWYNGSSAVGTDPFYIERWPSDGQAVYRVKALTFNYLDSPSTTSAITYGLQFSRNAGAALINMAGNTGGGVNNLTSTIHAIEIGA